MKLNGQALLGRNLKLDVANERDNGARWNQSNDKGQGSQSKTVFVKGIDFSLGVHEVKSSSSTIFKPILHVTTLKICYTLCSGEECLERSF